MIKLEENNLLLPETKDVVEKQVRRPWYRMVAWRWLAAICILTLSLLLNVFLITYSSVARSEYSTFARLPPELSVPWVSKSAYFGEGTDEEIDQAWDAISIDSGSIALSPAYTDKMGLPRAQEFPLDRSKGIYLLNGYHSMHCLKTIRTYIRQVDQGLPTDQPAHHMLHCLDALRQDVECYADDTPRYTGFQGQGRSGTGQVRQCRDWGRLEAWAQQHTACWHYLPELEKDGKTSLEEFKFCPQDVAVL